MADAPPSHDVNRSGSSLPPQTMRTAWTLLLIVHLLAVVLAVQANTLPVSPLRAKLGDTPLSLHLDVLHMNNGYAFHLTDGDTLDFDHSIEIELDPDTVAENADASRSDEPAVLRLPDELIWPQVRRRRLQRLALAVAERAGRGSDRCCLTPWRRGDWDALSGKHYSGDPPVSMSAAAEHYPRRRRSSRPREAIRTTPTVFRPPTKHP